MPNDESLRNPRSASCNLLPLASLLLVGSLILGAFVLDAPPGVPLDDAWIHFQFARNLARGDGFSFNPGQPTAGSTAPLWTLLLAGVYFVGGRFPVAGQILSAACFLAALTASYVIAMQLTGSRWLAWLAGMIVAVNGRLVWAGLAALETCLFAALSLLAIAVHLRNRANARYRPLTVVLFGLAALSRPEGYLLFALALADLTLGALRFTSYESRLTSHVSCLTFHVSRFTYSAFLFAAIVAPYLIFSLKTGGHLLPNTYHAKTTISFLPDRDFLSVAARYLILDNPLLLPFVLLGGLMLLKRAPLLSLWSAGLPLAYAFLHTPLYQHGRYLMPLIPCNAVLGAVGLLEAWRIVRRHRLLAGFICRTRAVEPLRTLAALLIIIGTAWRLPYMASQYAYNVEEINRMHVALGYWLAEHTSPDAFVALNDIGAIAYISGRPVVDLAGLVTPEVVPLLRMPDRDAQLAGFLAERNVEYVVIFPNWFPGLAANPALEPVYQVTLEHRTITGGETMVVYQAHWRR